MPGISTTLAIGVSLAILEDVALVAGGYLLGNRKAVSSKEYPVIKFEFTKGEFYESQRSLERSQS